MKKKQEKEERVLFSKTSVALKLWDSLQFSGQTSQVHSWPAEAAGVRFRTATGAPFVASDRSVRFAMPDLLRS